MNRIIYYKFFICVSSIVIFYINYFMLFYKNDKYNKN